MILYLHILSLKECIFATLLTDWLDWFEHFLKSLPRKQSMPSTTQKSVLIFISPMRMKRANEGLVYLTGSGDAILLLVNAGGKVDAEDKDGLTS